MVSASRRLYNLQPQLKNYTGTSLLMATENDESLAWVDGGVPVHSYGGTSLTRNRTTLEPYPMPMPRVLGGS